MTKDKFMQEEIKKDAGWIPIETLIKFNRLKVSCFQKLDTFSKLNFYKF